MYVNCVGHSTWMTAPLILQAPPHLLPTCPAIFEMGATLSAKTKSADISVLPMGFIPRPPPAPQSGPNRAVGKRAREPNRLTDIDQDLRLLQLKPRVRMPIAESEPVSDPNPNPGGRIRTEPERVRPCRKRTKPEPGWVKPNRTRTTDIQLQSNFRTLNI